MTNDKNKLKFSLYFNNALTKANEIKIDKCGAAEIDLMMFFSSIFAPEFRTLKSIQSIKNLGVNLDSIWIKFTQSLNISNEQTQELDIKFNNEFVEVINSAFVISEQLDSNFLEIEHIILAVLKDHKSGYSIFNDFNIDYEKYERQIVNKEKVVQQKPQENKIDPNVIVAPMIEGVGRDLYKECKEGKIQKVIGRDKEIELVIQTLIRKNKNNPVLIGAAGVGKTAIIEGLQLRIFNEDVPEFIKNLRIYDINVGNLIAGCRWRGQFEERVGAIIAEASKDPRIVIFFDEFHMIMGAGDNEGGSGDLSNILKPVLARGKFKCIGATTYEEYVRHIEKDSALTRRINIINVEEPIGKDLREIISKSIETYKNFYSIEFPDNLIDVVIDMSKHIMDRHSPDKVFDLIDLSMSRAKYNNKESVDLSILIDVVSNLTKLPSTFFNKTTTKEYVDGFTSYAKDKIIGQNEILEVCKKRLILSKINTDRPKCVILLDGPEGVGKTESALVLADYILGDRSKIKKIEMSKLKDKTSISFLEGTSAGYIGYNDSNNNLCEYIRKNHLAVVLLDEIDECSPEILDYFINAFESGYIEDAKSRRVYLNNTFFILTSNISSKIVRGDIKEISFVKSQHVNSSENALKEIKKRFKPKFIDRLTDIVVVNPLLENDIRKIANNNIMNFTKQIQDVEFNFVNIEKLIDIIVVENTKNKNYKGAREIRKIIENILMMPTSVFLMENENCKNIIVKVNKEGKICLQHKQK